MSNHLRDRVLIGTGAIALGLSGSLMAMAGPSMAKAEDGVRASGACSRGGHVALKAKHDDGRIEIELEVDSNRANQRWAVRITDNGAVVVSRHAETAGRSGSFTVESSIANRPGPDRIRARATFAGRTCAAAVVL